MNVESLASRLVGIVDGPSSRSVRVHVGDRGGELDVIEVAGLPGSRPEAATPVDCWFATAGDIETEAAGAVTIDALRRAQRFRVLDAPDADLQWFLMSLRSPITDRPYVGELLATVHGLTNDEALERLGNDRGASDLLLAGLRSEGQAMTLVGMSERLGGTGMMAWTIDAPNPMRATYRFGPEPSQPELGASVAADIEFTFTRLTYLLRILTGEHSIMKGLERGTVRIRAEGAALSALMEASAALG